MTRTEKTSFTLLLEIGCEELPSSFVDAALAALPDLFRSRLAALRITHGEIRALGTPRRLAALVHDVAAVQPDLDELVIGPPESAAFKEGKPTKAAEAFAQKLGVPVDALTVQDVTAASGKKPGRYVVGRRVAKGQPSVDLLGPVLADVCASIPFRKSMRWADYDTTFGRPVHWLVALAGDRVVDFEFAHAKAGRRTRGHRFLSPGFFDVGSAESYVEQLRVGHVLVDRGERERTMMTRIQEAANALGGTPDPDPDLIRENASLVEEPYVVAGGFDPAYLELPAAVIRAVARGHQKYFVVSGPGGGDILLPHYLAVVNTAQNPANVRKGSDRVMRARLADARFFFDEDRKTPLAERTDKLAGIVFHARLGTVREKVARIEAIAEHLAQAIGLAASDRELVVRAAHLCKSDLVSLMVGEFPELQGTMGRAYAIASGEPGRVADAIRDHYCPIGADGAVAKDDVARLVGLADRIDTLVGAFAVGLQPTGTADPFALRRACIGILRTLTEEAGAAYAKIHLGKVVRFAHALFAGKKLDKNADETALALEEFATERLRGLVDAQAGKASASAVLAGFAWIEGERVAPVHHPAFVLAKAKALQAAVDEKAAWLDTARTVAKRLSGISKEATPELVARSAFVKATDAAIVDLVEELDRKTARLETEHAVREALYTTATLAAQLDKIFVETLVKDPADPKTPERLRLLSYGASCMLRIADFSRLA